MTSEEYRQAIGELARGATMPADAAARMEARLGEAFEPAATSEKHVRRRSAARSLAAAAGIVITLGAGAWYAVRWPVTSNNVTPAADPKARAGKVHLQVDATDKVHLKADATDKVHPKVDAVEGGRSGSGSVRLQVDQTDRKLPKRLPPVIRPQGFVAVPAAAGLPQFESGVIVRMSLPVAALPSYGVDISPASSDQPVEADVLVGQDGRARAIRLVNISRSQQ
jgi:hypothetical protein